MNNPNNNSKPKILLTVVLKRIKYLGTHLTEKVEELH